MSIFEKKGKLAPLHISHPLTLGFAQTCNYVKIAASSGSYFCLYALTPSPLPKSNKKSGGKSQRSL